MEEKKISLELTQDQYLDLVKLMYLGNAVASEIMPEEATDRLEELEHHVMAASGPKKGNLHIGYDKKDDAYFLADDLEEELENQMDEYEENLFWEQLVLLLSLRDLRLKYTEKQLDAMSEDKLDKAIEEIQNFYINEFDENDLDNLKVVSLKKV